MSCLRNDQLALVKFAVHIVPTFKITGDPQTRKHIQAIVKCPVLRPPRVNGDIVHNMGPVGELGEIAAGQRIPVAKTVRRSDVLRQSIQLFDVVGRRFQKVDIIFDRCLEECVIIGVFIVHEIAGDKQPLDPLMTDAAGVRRHVHPLRERRSATAASRNAAELLFCKLCRLFNEDPVVFLALVFAAGCCAVAFHIAKLHRRAIVKTQHVMCGVVCSRFPFHKLQDRLNDRVF